MHIYVHPTLIAVSHLAHTTFRAFSTWMMKTIQVQSTIFCTISHRVFHGKGSVLCLHYSLAFLAPQKSITVSNGISTNIFQISSFLQDVAKNFYSKNSYFCSDYLFIYAILHAHNISPTSNTINQHIILLIFVSI